MNDRAICAVAEGTVLQAAMAAQLPRSFVRGMPVGLTRRDFLRHATIAALGAQAKRASALPRIAANIWAEPADDFDGPWRYRAFMEIVGTEFAVGDQHLLLDRVRPFPPQPGLESFCLYFHGRAARPLEEGIHCFRHEGRPDFDLFIEPGPVERGGVTHRAAVCRTIDPVPLGVRPA